MVQNSEELTNKRLIKAKTKKRKWGSHILIKREDDVVCLAGRLCNGIPRK